MRRAFYAIGAVVSMIAAFLLLVQAGLPAFSGETPPGIIPVAPHIGAIAPDFTAATPDGTIVKLTDARGQPTILNFWATWCGPCRVEMPILQQLYENTPNLRILAVNIGESPATIRQWQESTGLTYDLLVDTHQEIAAAYQLRGQPSTYIIAPDGMITDIFFGPANEQALVTAIQRSAGA